MKRLARIPGQRFLLNVARALAAYVLAMTFPSLAQTGTQTGPTIFSYEGRVYDSSGYPSLQKRVSFRLQVLNPPSSCVLLDEVTPEFDLSVTNGYFSVSLGQGNTRVSTANRNSTQLSLGEIFSNSPIAMTGHNNCSYKPNSGDSRRVRIFVLDGVSEIPMSPDITVGSTPYAMNADRAFQADRLSGKQAAEFLNLGPESLTQSNVEHVFSNSNFPKLQDLLQGTSSNYVRNASNGSVLLPTLNNAGTLQAGQFWYDANGHVLKFYNGSEVQTLGTSGTGIQSVSAGVGLTGGTITSSGTISLANTAVTAGSYGSTSSVGQFTVDPQGRLTAASNVPIAIDGSAITSGFVPMEKGGTGLTTKGSANQILGMKSDASGLEHKLITAGNGVTIAHSAGGISISATGSGGTVTNVTGTAPISVSNGTTIPAISISQANSTTNGFLSSTDWNTFNNKLGMTLPNSQVWVGNGSSVATARTLRISDLYSVSNSPFFTGSGCTSGQVLTYNSITDTMSCTTIVLTSQQVITALNTGPLVVNNGRVGIGGASATTLKIVDGNEGLGKVLTSDATGQASWQLSRQRIEVKSISTSPYNISAVDDGLLLYYSNTYPGSISLPALSSVRDGFSVTISLLVPRELTINSQNNEQILGGWQQIKMMERNLQSLTLVKLGNYWQLLNQRQMECAVGTECATADSSFEMRQIFAGTFNGRRYFTTPGGCSNGSYQSPATCNSATDYRSQPWASSATQNLSPTIGIAGTSTTLGTGAAPLNSFFDGQAQSSYLATRFSDTLAARFCEDMSYAGYSDWYLPARDELNLLYQNRLPIGGFVTAPYWSSTEASGTEAYYLNFSNGAAAAMVKSNSSYIRCVRRL